MGNFIQATGKKNTDMKGKPGDKPGGEPGDDSEYDELVDDPSDETCQ